MSTNTRPVLTSGSAHEATHELGQLLGAAGFSNSVSEGRNPFGIVDETVLAAINAYRSVNDVPAEDTIPGMPSHEASRWVGPNLWAALLTPAGKPRAKK